MQLRSKKYFKRQKESPALAYLVLNASAFVLEVTAMMRELKHAEEGEGKEKVFNKILEHLKAEADLIAKASEKKAISLRDSISTLVRLNTARLYLSTPVPRFKSGSLGSAQVAESGVETIFGPFTTNPKGGSYAHLP